MENKIKNKKFIGFWARYNQLFGLWQHNPQKPIPAIPASEVERDYITKKENSKALAQWEDTYLDLRKSLRKDYVPKAELERWETLWKNAKKVIAGNYDNAGKWEKKYRNLSKKIEEVKKDYVHKDKLKEFAEKTRIQIMNAKKEAIKEISEDEKYHDDYGKEKSAMVGILDFCVRFEKKLGLGK